MTEDDDLFPEAAPTGWRSRLPIHPACDLLPLLSKAELAELAELAEDIKQRGMQKPVELLRLGGELIDGRNRLDAAEKAGLPIWNEDGTLAVPHEIIEPPDDPVAYVISANLQRRHLSVEARKELTAKLLTLKPWSDKSSRQIADQTKLSRNIVGTLRAGLEDAGLVSRNDTRTDKRGRQQPATRQPPKKPRPDRQPAGGKQPASAPSLPSSETEPPLPFPAQPQQPPLLTGPPPQATAEPDVIAPAETIERQRLEIAHLGLELAAANATIRSLRDELKAAKAKVRTQQDLTASAKQIMKQVDDHAKAELAAQKAKRNPAKPPAAPEAVDTPEPAPDGPWPPGGPRRVGIRIVNAGEKMHRRAGVKMHHRWWGTANALVQAGPR